MTKQIKSPFLVVLGVLVINFFRIVFRNGIEYCVASNREDLPSKFRANTMARFGIYHGHWHCFAVNDIDFAVGES